MYDLMLCPRRLNVSDAYRSVTRVTDVHVAVCTLPSVPASESSKVKEIYELISFPEESPELIVPLEVYNIFTLRQALNSEYARPHQQHRPLRSASLVACSMGEV